MGRLHQAILIMSILVLSWLGMQIVHELGHVLAAWAGGDAVHRVVLHPLTISRTETSHERHPLLVIWGGPVLGVLLPLAALGLTRSFLPRWSYLVRFFAGSCQGQRTLNCWHQTTSEERPPRARPNSRV